MLAWVRLLISKDLQQYKKSIQNFLLKKKKKVISIQNFFFISDAHFLISRPFILHNVY